MISRRLTRQDGGTGISCPVCSTTSDFLDRATVLGRYEVTYFRCPGCGFVRAEEPYWLEEAYESIITGSDVGLVDRNIIMAKVARLILSVFFPGRGRYVDFGGGYGLFVRLMRDYGFDFYRSDKHCANIFSRDFEADTGAHGTYDLVTAFEVFEHLTDPLSSIDEMLGLSPHILFTTELLPVNTPKPSEWWYYGLEHGQHVSFYTRQSLSQVAGRFGLNFYTNGEAIHLFTRKRLSPALFRILTSYKLANFCSLFPARRSLLCSDYALAVGKLRKRETKDG